MGARSHRTIQTQGAAIRITESGSGEPACVFLHYWGGSGRTWDDVIDRIDGRVRCVAVDQRGWGDSIATDGRYDLAAMADDVQGADGIGRFAADGRFARAGDRGHAARCAKGKAGMDRAGHDRRCEQRLGRHHHPDYYCHRRPRPGRA